MPMPALRTAPADPASLDCDLIAVAVYEENELGPGTEAVDAALGGLLAGFLEESGFRGKKGETLAVPTPGRPWTGALLVGLGRKSDVTVQVLRQAAAAASRKAKKARRLGLTLALAAASGEQEEAVRAVAEGALLGAYEFLALKSKATPSSLTEVIVATDGTGDAAGAIARAEATASAVCWARDLVNTPAGGKPPAEIAQRVAERAAAAGIGCDIWEFDRIEAEKLGGLMGVAQGSVQEPRLVRLEYQPEGEASGTVALVGKGITFDSGGLSLKPPEGMETMKTDMSGAAAVCAAMAALPALQPSVRVIGYALFTENMPGGRAVKPGDVLRFRNGKTAEVLNTDAEGRLILADGLSLACEEEPAAVVDLATLTGACQVALGMRIAGLFASDEALAAQLEAAAATAGERVWRLPLPPDYRDLIDSEIADMKNTGGRYGGAITAALFLREFVTEGTPWAHIDIAGPARSDTDLYEVGKGGTGFGVRTLLAWLTAWRPDGA